MYTNEDLNNAITKGIFTEQSVNKFRSLVAGKNNLSAADEENFRLISGFNDIFVVIACLLLLASSAWVTHSIHPVFSIGVAAALSWGLAEFFVLKRRMALPAIVLLISFVGSVFALVIYAYASYYENPFSFASSSASAFMLAASISTLAAWLHWRRFAIPITIAAGMAAAATFVISLLVYIMPSLKEFTMSLAFLAGVVTFGIAMIWDAADRKRVTQKSDIAFWLHLLSAPLIVHPIFAGLGIFDDSQSSASLVIIVGLYIVLSTISLAIDRRAFMVSSLVYILYALTTLLKTYGLAGDSFAFAGVLIGFSLLVLSGFWHKARYQLVHRLPPSIQQKIPFTS